MFVNDRHCCTCVNDLTWSSFLILRIDYSLVGDGDVVVCESELSSERSVLKVNLEVIRWLSNCLLYAAVVVLAPDIQEKCSLQELASPWRRIASFRGLAIFRLRFREEQCRGCRGRRHA